jgi:hypothetical protein
MSVQAMITFGHVHSLAIGILPRQPVGLLIVPQSVEL